MVVVRNPMVAAMFPSIEVIYTPPFAPRVCNCYDAVGDDAGAIDSAATTEGDGSSKERVSFSK